ncbi:MAG: polysaccharide deacetylase family protein [Bacilli bacterium]
MTALSQTTTSLPPRTRRRHGARLLVGILALAAILGLLYALAVLDYAATPQFAVRFTPDTNLVQVRLNPGKGLLSQFVFAHCQLTLTTTGVLATALRIAPRRWSERISAGETVRLSAHVQGPLLAHPRLRKTVRAPLGAAVVSEQILRWTEVVHFTLPVKSIRLLTDPGHLVLSHTSDSLTLHRPIAAVRPATLDLTATNGETSTVQIAPQPIPPVPEYWFGASSGRRIYITIDDGWFPSRRVLALMKRDHLPLTAFLIAQAAREHPNYWKAFAAAGGVIEDHTVSHPWLTRVSPQAAEAQWAGPVHSYPDWFQQHPLVGRPPYGAVDRTVRSAARAARLRAIVMWSAQWNPTNRKVGLTTWNRLPLAPGEIVLLHWDPGLYKELLDVLAICRAQHLRPAPLLAGLPASVSGNSQFPRTGSVDAHNGENRL